MRYATTTDIETCIESIRARVADEGNTQWTRAVKLAFGELGERLGWSICAGGLREVYEREWLFDLVWYRDAEESLHELGLVLESEWDPKYKGIRYDFEKLLIAKARTKVMIFEAYGDDVRLFLDKMTASIHAYGDRSSQETYFLACYDPPKEQFIVEAVQTS